MSTWDGLAIIPKKNKLFKNMTVLLFSTIGGKCAFKLEKYKVNYFYSDGTINKSFFDYDIYFTCIPNKLNF